jgi:putative transposase
MTDVKAYKLKHMANAGKLTRLQSVLFAYRRLAHQWSKVQWGRYYQDGRFNKDPEPLETALPARMVQNCRDQVIGMLDSYVTNRQNDIKKIVALSSLSKEDKTTIYRINRGNRKVASSHPELYRLYCHIRKAVFKRNKNPCFKHINMQLAHGMKLEEAKGTLYDYWVRVMTPERGQLINIPIKTNGYYEKAKGMRNNAVQLNFKSNQLDSVVFTKTAEISQAITSGKVIGIDTGLSCLFATSEGDILGRRWIDDLSHYDKRIIALASRLQKQGIKPRDSKRYRHWVSKLRNRVKNEVNRCLNRLVAIHRPSVMVWERLRFQTPNLSRRLNRLIQNFGKGIIEQKKRQFEQQGIKQQEVNPAYTSQECLCGYVSKKNRPTQSKFKCKSCSKSANADVKSGKIILRRSQDKRLSQNYLRKTDILEILVEQYLERFKDSMNPKRVALLEGNYYFPTIVQPERG